MSIDLYDVVMKLSGPIEPVGEAYTDELRYKNLQQLTDLVDCLLGDISRISVNRSRQQFSMKRAGNYAHDFLQEIRSRLS